MMLAGSPSPAEVSAQSPGTSWTGSGSWANSSSDANGGGHVSGGVTHNGVLQTSVHQAWSPASSGDPSGPINQQGRQDGQWPNNDDGAAATTTSSDPAYNASVGSETQPPPSNPNQYQTVERVPTTRNSSPKNSDPCSVVNLFLISCAYFATYLF